MFPACPNESWGERLKPFPRPLRGQHWLTASFLQAASFQTLFYFSNMGADYKPLPANHHPSSSRERSPPDYEAVASLLYTALWVAFWIVCSVSIIIVNKHVITYSGFNFPICLALWHMFLGSITTRAAAQLLGIPDNVREQASPALYFQIGMIGVLFGGTLVTGNAALHMLTVPSVQMLKVGNKKEPVAAACQDTSVSNKHRGFLEAVAACVNVSV